ncbi:uncharacterized protein [Amphiura filiformis]|uniref:uncharacterized protein n=1 Tax=Amphiura filiformis TaxID=82378 RepID=UPI003B224541
MAEYTFLAGTSQSPQPSPGISESSPLNTQRPYTLPALINRTVFDMWFEQYKERSPGNFTQPFQECLYRQTLESFYLDFDLGEKGRLCPSYYDLIQCWPASEPGVHIRPCPAELNGVNYDTSENVSRLCHYNGTWGFEGKSDYNRCEPIEQYNNTPHEFPVMVITLSGYSISFAALVGAFVIFLYFKSLRCVRNYIHWNLVSSFILLYISFFVALVTNTQVIKDPSKYWVCRLLVTVLHYCIMTNFFWMFVEGVYLYTLVARALTVRKDRFWVYIILGWGVPTIFVSIFAMLNKFYDDGCWLNEKSNVTYIISSPIMFIICINLIFLIHIMCILVTKLRASHSLETQQYRKAVKGTLVLLPLLGVTYLIFIFKPVEVDKNSASFLIFQYLNALLHSTQGFFVAIIYVYMNQEVRNAIGRKIQRWREENTLPTKQVSRRGSGNSQRNNSLAQIFNSARRGSQQSAEEATTLPFRLPTSGDSPTDYHFSNGSRSPPFVRLDEIQPLNNTSPPSTSPTSKTSPPPPYNALFPVKEVDETVEQSEETEQGDMEENQPLRGDEGVQTEVDVMPNNHISVSPPDVICHTPLTNGPIEVETDLDNETLSDSGGGSVGGGGDCKTLSDKIDQNDNTSKQGPISNCLHEPVAITVGGDGNENNCNNNARRTLAKPSPGVGKRVSFEDEDNLHSSLSPRQFCETGCLTRGAEAYALPHSEIAQPTTATATGQSLRHDDVTDSRGKHANRVDSVEKSKQKNCILSDVRQKNSGIVNGSIIFPSSTRYPSVMLLLFV